MNEIDKRGKELLDEYGSNKETETSPYSTFNTNDKSSNNIDKILQKRRNVEFRDYSSILGDKDKIKDTKNLTYKELDKFDEEKLNLEKAVNQSAFAQFGNMLVQGVAGAAVLDGLKGIVDFGDWVYNIFKPGPNDYHNVISDSLDQAKEYIAKEFPIYRENPDQPFDLDDWGYWFSNGVSVFESIALMLPAMGETKAVSLLGKATKADKLINKGVKAVTNISNKTTKTSKLINGSKVGKYLSNSASNVSRLERNTKDFLKNMNTAFVSRTMENYMEAKEVYDSTIDSIKEDVSKLSEEDKNNIINRFPTLQGRSDDEIAEFIAGKSAGKTFAQDYWMLMFDLFQYKSIDKFWKGGGDELISKSTFTKHKDSIKQLGKLLGEETAEEVTKKGLSKRLTNTINYLPYYIKNNLIDDLGEGIEEMFQGYSSGKGEEYAKILLDKGYNEKDIYDYLVDPTIWEQGMWGVLGGIAFRYTGVGLGYAVNKIDTANKIKHGKIDPDDIYATLSTKEKIEQEEINKRFNNLIQLQEDLNTIKQGKSAFRFVKDENGQDTDERVPLTPEEVEVERNIIIGNFINTITKNAINAGSYNLLKEYIQSDNFGKALSKISDSVVSKSDVLKQMEETYNVYGNTIEEILTRTDASETTAKIIAEQILDKRTRLKVSNKRIDKIDEQINEGISEEVSTEDLYQFEKINLYDNIWIKLKELNSELAKLNEDETKSDIIKNIEIDNIKKKIKILSNSAEDLYRFKYTFKNENDEEFTSSVDKSGAILNDLNNIQNAKTIPYLMSLINDYIKHLDPDFKRDYNELSNLIDGKTQKAINEKNQLKILNSEIFTEIPKTTEEYKQQVESIDAKLVNAAKTRLNTAAKNVKNYISKQENIDNIEEEIINGNIKEIKDDLNLLKIGTKDTEEYSREIQSFINDERETRAKKEKEASEIKIDEKVESKEEHKKIDEELSKEETKVVDDEIIIGDIPSTGEGSEEKAINAINTELEQQLRQEYTPNPYEEVIQSYEPTPNSMAVSIASYEIIQIFKNDKILIDRAINKDINSPEFIALFNEVVKRLREHGVDQNIAEASALRGIRSGLNRISKSLESKDKKTSNDILSLINTIITKTEITSKDGTVMNATTTTVPDAKIYQLIDKLLENYIKSINGKIYKHKKNRISLKRFFYDLINNPDLNVDFDTINSLLYNMIDYIKNTNRFRFTNVREIYRWLNNPLELYNSVQNAKETESPVSNYMHINFSNENRENAVSVVRSLKPGDELECVPMIDQTGTIKGIKFLKDGEEIGFINNVVPNSTNTGYTRYTKSGIIYTAELKDGKYVLNTDELFNALLEFEDFEPNKWFTIIEKAYTNLSAIIPYQMTQEEINDILYSNDSPIKKAINQGIIKIPENIKNNGSASIFKFVVEKLGGVLFFDNNAMTEEDFRESYNSWKENIYTNFDNTHKIALSIEEGKQVKIKYANIAHNKKTSSGSLLLSEKEHGINTINLNEKDNPLIIFKDNECINEQTGKSVRTTAPFSIGTMGMKIGGSESNPIIALFTSANSVNGQIKKDLQLELKDILNKYTSKEYDFNKVRDRLFQLFNGSSISGASIFSGYHVVANDKAVGLAFKDKNGELKFVLKVHKYRPKSEELGTGITYSKNGDNTKSVSTISGNEAIIDNAINEIISNVKYNRTFFTINNFDKPNTDNNVYIYKKNGKLVLKLNNNERKYNNFGDFVLKENAFNTYQDVDKYGSYVSIDDKLQSMFIDVSTIEKIDNTTSPVEEIQSPADYISKNVRKTKPGDTRKLLTLANIPQSKIAFLLGDNTYGIKLINDEFYYDKNGRGEYARYDNGKIYLTNKGLTRIKNNAFEVFRLLFHENIHNKFNETSALKKESIINETIETYERFIEAINEILNSNIDKNSNEYKNAKLISDWVKVNNFNLNDYFNQPAYKNKNLTESEKRRIFAEEWLVESFTQGAITNFLNDTIFKEDEIIETETIKNEDKSIWQKIIDLILNLFNISNTNPKNNSILAKQYVILSDTTITDNTLKNITEQTEETQTKTEETNEEKEVEKQQTEEVKTQEPTKVDETVEQYDSTDFNNINGSDILSDNDYVDEILTDDELMDMFATTTSIETIETLSNKKLFDTTTKVEDILINTAINNSSRPTAKTFGVTEIMDMQKFIDSFPIEYQPLIVKMMMNGEIKFVCR